VTDRQAKSLTLDLMKSSKLESWRAKLEAANPGFEIQVEFMGEEEAMLLVTPVDILVFRPRGGSDV
jgi:hypothetical protein